MDIQRLLTSLSLKIIIQFVIAIIAIAGLIGWNFDFINQFYFQNQQTQTGIIINSSIVGLLIFGLLSILLLLLRYRREEQALAIFVKNIESFKPDLAEGIPSNSLIGKRFTTMQSIRSANGEINHSALSAMLTADEATRFGLVKFINNILILTGVFGTIVSLSIALLGASDLIDSAAGSLGGMGLVIHGMSTALSTTITAIISYVRVWIFLYAPERRANAFAQWYRTIDFCLSVTANGENQRRCCRRIGSTGEISSRSRRKLKAHTGDLPGLSNGFAGKYCRQPAAGRAITGGIWRD